MKQLVQIVALLCAMVLPIAHGQDRQQIFDQIMDLVGKEEYLLASQIAGQLDNNCQYGYDILLYPYKVVRKGGVTDRYVTIFYADEGTVLHDLPGFPQRILERIYASGQTVGDGDIISLSSPIKIDCTKKTPEPASRTKKIRKSGRA